MIIKPFIGVSVFIVVSLPSTKYQKMIDFHTHQPPVDNDSSVRSLLISEVDKITPHDLFTIGIHPWYTEEMDLKAHYSLVNEFAQRSNVIGIGEIGLDKHRGAPIEKQIEVFEKQVLIAEKLNKPVIIHCVRAWAELLELKKRLKPEMPWAIHGFRGQSELVKQLLSAGMYISFGPESLNASEGLQESIRTVPLNRLFVETDDADVSLKYLYTTISKIKRITTRDLEENINDNFAEFFG
ncbi:MAG TPA: hydrolase TatD [Bacteroidales bacterium]|nr:hydrolase TatD [Bacteroidales bacterium]